MNNNSGKNNGKNNDVVIWASDDKEQFYDLVADNLLDYNVSRMNDVVNKGKDVMMIYETFVGSNKKLYNGLDTVFKLEGLIEIFNRYFARNKIDLAVKKDVYNGYESIRIYRFVRIKGGGGGGESVLLKTERKTERDDVEIIENDGNDKSKDEEKIKKKIEEERRLIREG